MLLLIGCGGGSNPEGTAGATSGTTGGSTGLTGGNGGTGVDVQFGGNWSGSYAEPSLNPLHGGTMRIAIASAVITGTFHDSAAGDGTVSGSINQSNFTVVTFTPVSGTGVTTYGDLRFNAQGRLMGIVPTTSDQDSRPPEIDFLLDKVTSP